MSSDSDDGSGSDRDSDGSGGGGGGESPPPQPSAKKARTDGAKATRTRRLEAVDCFLLRRVRARADGTYALVLEGMDDGNDASAPTRGVYELLPEQMHSLLADMAAQGMNDAARPLLGTPKQMANTLSWFNVDMALGAACFRADLHTGNFDRNVPLEGWARFVACHVARGASLPKLAVGQSTFNYHVHRHLCDSLAGRRLIALAHAVGAYDLSTLWNSPLAPNSLEGSAALCNARWLGALRFGNASVLRAIIAASSPADRHVALNATYQLGALAFLSHGAVNRETNAILCECRCNDRPFVRMRVVNYSACVDAFQRKLVAPWALLQGLLDIAYAKPEHMCANLERAWNDCGPNLFDAAVPSNAYIDDVCFETLNTFLDWHFAQTPPPVPAAGFASIDIGESRVRAAQVRAMLARDVTLRTSSQQTFDLLTPRAEPSPTLRAALERRQLAFDADGLGMIFGRDDYRHLAEILWNDRARFAPLLTTGMMRTVLVKFMSTRTDGIIWENLDKFMDIYEAVLHCQS